MQAQRAALLHRPVRIQVNHYRYHAQVVVAEADIRKYGALLAKVQTLDAVTLQQQLNEARQSDAAEVEPLRAVAYNDVVLESYEPEALIKLTPMQKLIGVLA